MMSPSLRIDEGAGVPDGRAQTQKRRKASRVLLSRAFLVLASITLVHPAVAQSEQVIDLRWDSPSQCPQVDYVQDHIREIVGQVEVDPSRLRADGRLVRNGERYRLTLVITSGDASGKRVLESDSCDHLAGAAAVALGFLVRAAQSADSTLAPEVLGEPAPPAPTPPSAPPTAATPLIQEPPRDAPISLHTAAAVPVHTHLRFPAIAAGVGTAPGLTLGYGFGLGVEVWHWQALLTGYYFPQRHIQSKWPGYGATLTRYAADLDVCRTWQLDNFEAGPCVRVGLMLVSATGTGELMSVKTARTTVLTAGASLNSWLHLSKPVALFLSAAPELMTVRPRLVNPAFGQIYEFPLLSFKVTLGSEWIF